MPCFQDCRKNWITFNNRTDIHNYLCNSWCPTFKRYVVHWNLDFRHNDSHSNSHIGKLFRLIKVTEAEFSWFREYWQDFKHNYVCRQSDSFMPFNLLVHIPNKLLGSQLYSIRFQFNVLIQSPTCVTLLLHCKKKFPFIWLEKEDSRQSFATNVGTSFQQEMNLA